MSEEVISEKTGDNSSKINSIYDVFTEEVDYFVFVKVVFKFVYCKYCTT